MAKNWAEFNQPPTNDIYTAPRLGVSGAMVFNELWNRVLRQVHMQILSASESEELQ